MSCDKSESIDKYEFTYLFNVASSQQRRLCMNVNSIESFRKAIIYNKNKREISKYSQQFHLRKGSPCDNVDFETWDCDGAFSR